MLNSKKPALTALDRLPPPNTHWVASRKMKVLNAIRAGQVTREEVLARYDMSEDELQSWEHNSKTHRSNGLKVTKIQLLRQKET